MDQQDIVDELSRLADQNARLEAELRRLSEERLPHVDRSSRRRDRRLTVAYVLVTALVVGLASVGSATALAGSNTVFSDDIVDGTVSSLDVKNNAVITSDIKDNSIAGRDIADGTIGSADVANGSITGVDIDLFNDNRCTGETVMGTALINADPGVPSILTTDWVGYPHSCSGQPVRVRRIHDGLYEVSFGFDNPARLATVTQNTSGVAPPSAVISVESLDPGYFLVKTKVGGLYEDVDFTIVLF